MVETVSESIEESPKPIMGGTHDLSPSTVTLSGLLNAIDGVSSQVSDQLHSVLTLASGREQS